MATSVVPLVPEVGTELCRVKLEGGILGGYRCDILTENLSEREGALFKCPRCDGIMKDGSISYMREQLCFVCLGEGEKSICDAPVRNTIQSLRCGCPLSKRGCDWVGRLECVEKHLTTCVHVYASCQLRCGVVLARGAMRRHTRMECSQRGQACLHCLGVHKVCDMAEHVEVCGKVEMVCELGCGVRVRRESVLCHRESDCSEETVVCPYVKYRCEVVGLKRHDLKQHLEENMMLHMELKLNTIEEKNQLYEKKFEILESKLKSTNEEIEFLRKFHLREEGSVNWSIKNILNYFKSDLENLSNFTGSLSVAGYNFHLFHNTDALNFNIYFAQLEDNHDVLEWPLKAIYITRVICHRDDTHSLILKSPIIETQKAEWHVPKKVCSIPLSTDLKGFIRSESLDLEITLRILTNK